MYRRDIAGQKTKTRAARVLDRMSETARRRPPESVVRYNHVLTRHYGRSLSNEYKLLVALFSKKRAPGSLPSRYLWRGTRPSPSYSAYIDPIHISISSDESSVELDLPVSVNAAIVITLSGMFGCATIARSLLLRRRRSKRYGCRCANALANCRIIGTIRTRRAVDHRYVLHCVYAILINQKLSCFRATVVASAKNRSIASCTPSRKRWPWGVRRCNRRRKKVRSRDSFAGSIHSTTRTLHFTKIMMDLIPIVVVFSYYCCFCYGYTFLSCTVLLIKLVSGWYVNIVLVIPLDRS